MVGLLFLTEIIQLIFEGVTIVGKNILESIQIWKINIAGIGSIWHRVPRIIHPISRREKRNEQ